MSILTIIFVDGLGYAAWLFLVAVGMTLIFGVMRILNIAHGSFYAFGAYVCAILIGRWFDAGLPSIGAYPIILFSAIVVGGLLGLLLQQGILKHLQRRDEVAIVLATFALFLILDDTILLVWGTDAYPAFQPYADLGTIDISGIPFALYDLLLIALAVVIGGSLWFLLNRTNYGKLLIAIIHDPDMARAIGVNVDRIFPTVFIIGAMLAALGGASSAPKISVAPGIGVDVIILAFAVVVIGGMGSIAGTMIGALMVGFGRAFAVYLVPELELFVIYAIMTAVLIFRPQGLFVRPAARKI
ncbi:branched-chain amino acid ABC transporter permease [Rhizobium chutanense]|uniref:Branched-chain amino acid ABC transporter permease n=1 Tax=Rhizobium chutanense TaxID=2035448 RepID=A0A2A6JBE2_9HYPH|nr:branched-chain amino acid ABC transporter permease [Rhizobium chutanense]PDT03240.1 branched-chain amino acid ABC transporter permease [Rhizobium chutanense]